MITDIQKTHQSIIEECNRASAIIELVLKQSRPSTGKKERLNLTKIAEDALALARFTPSVGSIAGVTQYAPEPLWVEGMAVQISEVLVNLIINACQAMEAQGGGTLTVSTRQQGLYAEASVADTGPGIAPEHLKRLFEPFFTTRHEGTGLGLFLCHRIIREHQGHIEVASQVGQGTTFTVKLPLMPPSDPEAPA